VPRCHHVPVERLASMVVVRLPSLGPGAREDASHKSARRRARRHAKAIGRCCSWRARERRRQVAAGVRLWTRCTQGGEGCARLAAALCRGSDAVAAERRSLVQLRDLGVVRPRPLVRRHRCCMYRYRRAPHWRESRGSGKLLRAIRGPLSKRQQRLWSRRPGRLCLTRGHIRLVDTKQRLPALVEACDLLQHLSA